MNAILRQAWQRSISFSLLHYSRYNIRMCRIRSTAREAITKKDAKFYSLKIRESKIQRLTYYILQITYYCLLFTVC